MRKFLLAGFILMVATVAAQEIDALSLMEERVSLQQNGMKVLGGWALANLAGSGYMMSRTSGWQYRFHQMNVFWNVVNLGIAAGGYFGAGGQGNPSAFEVYESYADFGKILLLNAGLDIAYITAGFFLQERSKNVSKRSDMYKGYGKSLILQGGFLLVFDAALYWINQSRMDIFTDHNFELALNGNMLHLTYCF